MKALSLIPLALVLCLVSLPAAEKPPVPPGVKNASVEEFDKLRAEKNAVVLDVRTEKEFKEGHIPGAVNLDVTAPDFAKKVAALDKDKTYLVHCASGRRSLKACSVMKDASFKTLVNLEDGFNAWSKAGKPVEKK
jgi:phage shock protein E